jgi:hypothetical protein
MAITVSAALQLGAVDGCLFLGIMSLKPDSPTTGQYAPLPHAWGPMCDRCWLERGGLVPESSGRCPHGGAS